MNTPSDGAIQWNHTDSRADRETGKFDVRGRARCGGERRCAPEHRSGRARGADEFRGVARIIVDGTEIRLWRRVDGGEVAEETRDAVVGEKSGAQCGRAVGAGFDGQIERGDSGRRWGQSPQPVRRVVRRRSLAVDSRVHLGGHESCSVGDGYRHDGLADRLGRAGDRVRLRGDAHEEREQSSRAPVVLRGVVDLDAGVGRRRAGVGHVVARVGFVVVDLGRGADRTPEAGCAGVDGDRGGGGDDADRLGVAGPGRISAGSGADDQRGGGGVGRADRRVGVALVERGDERADRATVADRCR